MGNTPSSKVAIHLDHERGGSNLAVVAGNDLKGRVVGLASHSEHAPQIRLYIIGKEKTFIRQGKQSSSGERQVFGCYMDLPLPSRQAGSSEGLSLPFSVPLPTTLPSSVHGRDSFNTSSTYRLQYKIFIIVNGKSVPLGKRLFSVASSPLPDTRVGTIVNPAPHPITSVAGTRPGVLLFGAKLIDAHVGRGTHFILHLVSRNESRVDIERVGVKLVEDVKFHARHRRVNSTTTLYECSDVKLPGLLRGKQDERVIEVASPEMLRDMYADLQKPENQFIVRIPYGARDTYKGQIITIQHYLKIKLHTKTFVSNPAFSIPVRIGFPPVQSVAAAPAPATSISSASPAIAHATPVSTTPTASAAPAASNPPPSAPPQTFDMANYSGISVRAFQDNEYPVAEATLVPLDNLVEAPMATAPSETITIGGNAVFLDQEDEGEGERGEDDDLELISAGPLSSNNGIDISSLLEEMAFSINDYEIISNKLRNDSWVSLFSELSPQDFGSIIAHVNMDDEQPRVGELLAQHGINQFTCEHCVQAIKNSADYVRSTLVERLLPYCTDIVTGHESIRSVMTEWEILSTQSAFETAIRMRSQ